MQEQLLMTLRVHMVEQYGAKKLKEEKKQQPLQSKPVRALPEPLQKKPTLTQVKPVQPSQLSVERPQLIAPTPASIPTPTPSTFSNP